MLLNIDWVKPGKPCQPTLLAFSGFGHRLDPWTRLAPKGWRVGVVGFPVGNPPSEAWTPETLTAQLERFWGEASHRAIVSFSFGAAGATQVGNILAKAEVGKRPELVAYIAPVQWAKAPWSILKRVRPHRRLKWLQRLSVGATKVSTLSSKLGGPALEQIVRIVENHIGWDFVAHYLPYIDWIQTRVKTVRAWDKHPWPCLLIGASMDKTVPCRRMAWRVKYVDNVTYHQVEANHFNALDSARPLLTEKLEKLTEALTD